MFRDVWVHQGLEDTHELRLAATRLILPDRAVLCGETAAWLHGVDVRRQNDLEVHASFPKGRRIRPRPGLRVYQETLDVDDVMLVDGVLVTTPLRTAFDCARWLKGVERVVVVDALAHIGLVSIEEIREYCFSKHRLRNLRVAELLLDDADPGAESPMETRTRMVFVRAGLPRPETQIEVFDPATGAFVARLDMGWRELKLAAEYDGEFHQFQRAADEARRARLRALGWEVHVFRRDDVYGRPMEMAAEMTAALLRRRLRRPAAPASYNVECNEAGLTRP
jgi:hypothetical protein